MESDQSVKYHSIILDDVKYRTTFNKKYEQRKPYDPPNPKLIKAFIPGTIRKVYVKKGNKVKHNDKLLILEAMKMKNVILAPFDGKIKSVHVKEGSVVSNKELLIEFE
ncbi:MAG: acetyl-CoA carboxylase biotin carboxyl carrier protein subunit [Sphingobacteriia bacterium]|nr:acetyl-CoA carboxylase biotin carboxyl carrier protein subunit [Sphingobacteriia bacterium]